jgi:hypothetical protein
VTNTTLLNSVAVGYNAQISYNNAVTSGDSVCVGANSTALANAAVVVGCNSYCGNNSAAIGSNCGKSTSSGGYNLMMGGYAGSGLTNGGGNMLIGPNSAMNLTSGNNNCFLGVSSGNQQTTQSNNTCLGYYTDCSNGSGTYYANCTSIGANCRGYTTGANQMQLGDSTVSVYTQSAVNTRSDARDKIDIRNTQLGLGFIEKLRPVDFRWDRREDYVDHTIDENHHLTSVHVPKDGSRARVRFHHGLVAQEVRQVMSELGTDFGGFQDHKVNGGDDVLSIGYEEFISPLIRAVQELSQKIKVLEAKYA